MKISKKLKMAICFLFFTSLNFSVIAEGIHTVKANETLERIIKKVYPDSALSKEQLMVAVLYNNSSAFSGGNIHFLNRGKKLTLVEENQLPVFTQSQAKRIIKEHTRYFKKGKTGKLKLPEPVGMAKLNPKELEDRQKQQLQNLTSLQKETDELKQRLDKLMAEKQASDQKLESLQQELKKTQ